jgi:ABC-type transporter Mla MlaB component
VLTGQQIYDDGVLRIIRTGTPPELIVSGEIDESTYPGLLKALANAMDGQGELHVNLAGVAYCDLAGLRAIVQMTGADDGSGSRRVVLHEMPVQLATVLAIVGWDITPGLTLEGRANAGLHGQANAGWAGLEGRAGTSAGLGPAVAGTDGGLNGDGQRCDAGA